MSIHGRYVMLRKIADGGMAEIFLAKQTGEEGFSRPVIVKRILPAFSSDPHFRDMLLDEAHIAMSLNHSNVVPVLDLGRAEGSYFLVMDLVDGWDLEQIFLRAYNAGFPLPLGLALYITAEVCRGLGYAHSRRDGDGQPLAIVHRDVSPQNILLSEHGEVKVTDFGIAKALGRRDRTQQGMIKGKLDFMSPEQASGAPLDASSDIFAAGSVLYLLCTGQRPFASPSDMESLARVQRANFAPPEQLRPDLPPAVGRIIMRAMRANPGERYPSAEEMMFDIEAVIRDEFGSPGQSQLRQWLAELSERDGGVPISRATAGPAGPSLTSRWFAEGEMLSFDDSSSIGISPRAPDLAWNAPAPASAVHNPSPSLAVHFSPNAAPPAYSPVPPHGYPPHVHAPPGYQPALHAPHHSYPAGGHAPPPPPGYAPPGYAPPGYAPLAAPVLVSAPGHQPAYNTANPSHGPAPGSISPIVWDAPGNAATFSAEARRSGRGGRGTQQRRRLPGWATRSVTGMRELPRRRSFLRSFLVLLLLVGAGGFVASQVLSPAQQASVIGEARSLWQRGQIEAAALIERIKSRNDVGAPSIGLERAPAGAGLGNPSPGRAGVAPQLPSRPVVTNPGGENTADEAKPR